MSDKGTIQTEHPSIAKMSKIWARVEDCLDGEDAIKDKGDAYLPNPDTTGEDKTGKDYHNYKLRASFTPAAQRTHLALMGIAFKEAPTIVANGKMSESFVEDCNGAGVSISQFAKDVVSNTLSYGRGVILSDFTSRGTTTLVNRGKPLLIFFKHNKIKNWRVVNGKLTLIVLEYEEPADEEDSFTLDICKKWIELRLVEVEGKANKVVRCVFHELDGDSTIISSEPFFPTESGGKNFEEIPVSWVGSVNNDYTIDNPPLLSIVNKNISHYQADADYAECAFIVGQPLFTASMDENWRDEVHADGIRLGSKKAIMLPVDGSVDFRQAEDRNLSRQRQQDLLADMVMLGAALVQRNTTSKTATQVKSEDNADNSVLTTCISNAEAAIKRAIGLLKRYASDIDVSVSLNTSFDEKAIKADVINAIIAATNTNYMRRSDLISYLKEIGLIKGDESIEEIEQQLDNQNSFEGV